MFVGNNVPSILHVAGTMGTTSRNGETVYTSICRYLSVNKVVMSYSLQLVLQRVSGVPIGNICANFFSGFIISSRPEAWPYVFYCFGTIAVVWVVIWLLVVYNDPHSHPFISSEECKYLHETIGCIERQKVGSKYIITYVEIDAFPG